MGYVEHSFYCTNCGRKGIPLQRKKGHQHGRFHLKKLYCIYCQEEINHVECKTAADVEKFQSDFKKGKYKDVAKDSLAYVRAEWSGKELLGKTIF